MRRRIWIIVALAVLVGTAGGAALATAARKAHRTCGLAQSKTIAANRTARIYTLQRSGQTVVYGCASGRRTRLGTTVGVEHLGRIALAGSYGGFEVVSMGVDTSAARVRVVNLASGRTVHDDPAATHVNRPESFISVAALVLGRHGGVAWIARRGAIGLAASYEVREIDAAGAKLLDRSSTIDPSSLRLRGTTVSWADGGAPRNAQLR